MPLIRNTNNNKKHAKQQKPLKITTTNNHRCCMHGFNTTAPPTLTSLTTPINCILYLSMYKYILNLVS